MLRRRPEAQLKALAAPNAALGRALEPLCGAQKHVVVIVRDDAAYLGMRLGKISPLFVCAFEILIFGEDVGVEVEHRQLKRVREHLYAMGAARRAATVQKQTGLDSRLFELCNFGVAEFRVIYDVQNAFSKSSVI